jgi:hypothetical protein
MGSMIPAPKHNSEHEMNPPVFASKHDAHAEWREISLLSWRSERKIIARVGENGGFPPILLVSVSVARAPRKCLPAKIGYSSAFWSAVEWLWQVQVAASLWVLVPEREDMSLSAIPRDTCAACVPPPVH